jgi:DNA topoisomerase-1
MESAELERTTADITAQAGGRTIDLRATGTVVKFDGFLTLYTEDRDEPEEDEESRRLPEMSQGERLEKRKIDATQHFTEPPPRYSEASLVKRMEELGIGRPSTYASILQVLKDRKYVRLDKRRLVPEDRGRVVVAFLESFFQRYVEYDFTANLEEQLDRISNAEIDWREVLRDFWRDFISAVGDIKDLRISQVIDALNEMLAPHIFPPNADGTDPRACTVCGTGQLSLKLGRFGAFIGCSNYPECKNTRPLSTSANGGDAAATRLLGQDPDTGLDVTLRSGRFGPYIQLGEAQDGEKPKRAGLPRGTDPASVDLDMALKLLSLPREVGRHPEDGEPILAGIGRFGPYIQHGKTYANLEPGDDVLAIGLNRAVTLIAEKVARGPRRRFGADPGRSLGDHPSLGGPILVKNGRYGPYVSHEGVNATLPNDLTPETVTLERAVELLAARAEAMGGAPKRGGKRPAKAKPAKEKPASKAGAQAQEAVESAPNARGRAPAARTSARAKSPAPRSKSSAKPAAKAKSARSADASAGAAKKKSAARKAAD